MFLRFEATMNGKKFSRIAEELILIDIVEDAAEMDVQTSALAGRDGLFVASRRRKSLSVSLTCVIRTQDIKERRRIMQKVAEWAGNGGKLEINPRPGKYLMVQVDEPPALGSHLKWTEELTLTFVAYDVPYWLSDSSHALATAAQGDGTYADNEVIAVGGDVDKAEASLTLVSPTGTLTALKITCGDTEIEFAGLPDISPVYVSIGRENGVFFARNLADNKSMLPYRTAESSDALHAMCGKGNVPFQVTANTALTGTVTFAERWL